MIQGSGNKKAGGQNTGAELWEYVLVAHPDKTVSNQINEEKKYFFDEYKEELTLQPHITIAHFFAKEQMEDILIRWIRNVCHNHPGFTTTLNNFSGTPSHKIFFRVQNPQPLKKLANDLKILESFIEDNDCPPVKFSNAPHLTLARKLTEKIYTKAIHDYAGRLFHASFEVTELQLLKRKNKTDECRQVNIFCLPPETKNFN